MKSLTDILQYASQKRKELSVQAKKIHPLLLSRVTDASDTSLYNNELQDKFNDFYLDVDEVNKIIWDDAKRYYESIMIDFSAHDIEIGFNTNGTGFDLRDLNVAIYEPSFEIEPIYKMVLQFRDHIKFTPFWKYSVDILDPKTNCYFTVQPSLNPIMYINSMSSNAKHVMRSNNEMFIIACKTELNTPYKMSTSLLYPDVNSATKSVKEYSVLVQEHKVLEELLKHEPNKEYQVKIQFNDFIEVLIKEIDDVDKF